MALFPWTLVQQSLVLLAVLLPLCYLVFAIVVPRRKFVNSLKSLPGPPALPLLGNALILTGGQDDFFRLLKKCAAQFGECFVLWVGLRPFVFLQSAEVIQPILSSSLHIDKSYEYSFLSSWVGNGLITSTGMKWHSQRKLLTPTFHSRILSDFAAPIQRGARVFVSRLALAAQADKVFNIIPYAKRCTLSLMCDTALGYHSNVQYDDTCAYSTAIEELSAIMQRRFITPWLKPDVIFNATSWGRRQRKCVRTIHAFTDSVIEERKKELQRRLTTNGNIDATNGKDAEHQPAPNKVPHSSEGRTRLALLDLLLELQTEAAKRGEQSPLTDKEIRDQVNTFLFAGHDTTAAGVSWCLYVLGKYPDLQEQLVAEAMAAQTDGEFTLRSTQLDMPLLDSCIRECMRLYPLVPLIARDIKHPVNIGAHTLLPGVTVLMNLYLLHRDPRYFPEPEKFIPSRFLNFTNSVAPNSQHPFAYIPFSAGSRNCIGQRFAMMELKIILAEVLMNFEVRSEVPHDSLNLMGEIVLLNKEGINLSLNPRH